MAVQTTASFLEAISRHTYHPMITDQANQAFVLHDILWRRKRTSWRSKIIDMPVYLANPGNVGYRKRGEPSNVTAIAKEDKGQTQFVEVVGGFGVDVSDLHYASGDEAVVDLLDARAEQAKVEIVNFLIDEYLGASLAFTDEKIEGLGTALSTTAVCMNIDPAVEAEWKAQNPSLLTANTLSATDLFYWVAISDSEWPGGDKMFLCNDAVAAKVFALAQSNQRYVGQDDDLAKIGHRNFTVAGAPVISEPRMQGGGFGSTNNRMYLLNLSAMALYVHPEDIWTREVVKTRERQHLEEYYLKMQVFYQRRNSLVFNNTINPSL